MRKYIFMATLALLAAVCPHTEADAKAPITKPQITIEGGRLTPEALWAMGRINSVLPNQQTGYLAYTVSYYSVAENRSTSWIRIAKEGEKDLGPAHLRLFGTEAFFQNKILYDDEVVMTIRAKSNDFVCITDKRGMSPMEIVHSQTFPEDYDFGAFNLSNVTYICGMSVPPIMIKRIVTRLIESGVFK
jgi:site-specific DNA-cytosine methylase